MKIKIWQISSFNFLLKSVEGNPKEEVLRLPHSAERHEERKRTLKGTYTKILRYKRL